MAKPNEQVQADLVPTFTSPFSGTWLVRHRRDDPLPEGSTIEVLKSDGTVELVTIKGRLALRDKSKAKTHTYLFKKVFGGGVLRQGNVRLLDGSWSYGDAPETTLYLGD